MIESKMMERDKFESFYNELIKSDGANLAGYIQMSDKRIKNIFPTPKESNNWEKLNNSSNFIYEAAFFNKTSNISTLIRQIDDEWLVNTVDFNKKYDNSELTEESFISKAGGKIKIKHIWEEKNDEQCEDMPVLKHVYSAFVGFDTHPNSSNHPSPKGNLNGENNNKGGK